ncbi:hypothetical protein GCM10010483_41830 [Actinokineospora diospyrosa]
MKRFSATLLALTIMIATPLPALATTSVSLSVLAFNIYQLPRVADGDTAAKQRRAGEAEALIRSTDPGVLVLSEAFSAEAESLRAQPPPSAPSAPSRSPPVSPPTTNRSKPPSPTRPTFRQEDERTPLPPTEGSPNQVIVNQQAVGRGRSTPPQLGMTRARPPSRT